MRDDASPGTPAGRRFFVHPFPSPAQLDPEPLQQHARTSTSSDQHEQQQQNPEKAPFMRKK